MKILTINPLEFLTWDTATTLAPSSGLTLITGVNGAGKTALGLELPAWLLWGETVRGTSPRGYATGQFNGPDGNVYQVHRRWARGGKDNKVAFMRGRPEVFTGSDADLTGQTATETQERIDRVFGSWRRFSSTRVFSRRLLNRFGGATNKERVALLEEVLGLDRFERAYRWAREERGRRADVASRTDAELVTAGRVLVQAQSALNTAVLKAGDTPDKTQAALAEAVKKRDGAQAKEAQLAELSRKAFDALNDATARANKARTEGDVSQRRLDEMRRQVNLANKPKVCPTCQRPFDQASGAAAQQHLAGEIAELERTILTIRTLQAELEQETVPLRATYARVDAKRQSEAQAYQVGIREVAGLEAAWSAAKQWEAQLQALQAQVEKAANEESAARTMQEVRRMQLAVADAACTVLGPKGARAKLLEGSLALLEMEANYVLPRMGGKIQAVRIKGSRAKADGGTVDEVSIEVVPAIEGHYRGVSDGEQVRLDVALLLALARISGDSGYVAFDEVFDALDEAGLAGAAELLEELARDRQVIVMSHNARFQDLLPGAERLRAVPGEDGRSRLEAA